MKRNRLASGLAVAWLMVAVACGNERPNAREEEDTKSAAQHATEAPRHAPAGVSPGSHEDWCGEHQVPESMCTRCNPSLIAAFKATGDWCAEHGLPESQCLACTPDLKIERPARQDTTP